MLSTVLLLLLLNAEPDNLNVRIVGNFSSAATCNEVKALVAAEEAKPGYNGPIISNRLQCFTMFYKTEDVPENAPTSSDAPVIKCKPKKVLGKDVNCREA